MIRVAPSTRAKSASRTASLAESCWTLAAPKLLGSRMASGAKPMTASRSASVSPESSALTPTTSAGPPPRARACLRNWAAVARVAALFSGAAWARSTASASAPLASASASRFSSAGAMMSERIAASGRENLGSPAAHEGGAAALGDQRAVLLERPVPELDQPRVDARLRIAHGQDFRLGANGVALEQRRRKGDVGHAEIGDGRADRGVVDGNADHQPEREQRIHQRPAPFGLGGAKMGVDMQRLRVQRHVREQHVVHLGDGAGQAVAKVLADREVLEIEAAARMAKGSGLHGRLRVTTLSCH